MSEPKRPAFLDKDPVQLRFGTSGLRGLVADMTDLEVYVNVQGFLRFLERTGGIEAGATVALARDLRDVCPKTGIESSPRIARAVSQAVRDAGYRPVDLGAAPTPVLACYVLARGVPGVMVTGSHIPADRNGVKFYKKQGEVLKSDEAAIFEAVAEVRARIYAQPAEASAFGADGQLKARPEPAELDPTGTASYAERYLAPFGARRPLAGKKIVFYQHSSVARDLLTTILEGLGADVIAEHRVDHFVPVDTEDVMPEDEAKYRALVDAHGADALISTDGDGDRPLIVDETGRFHRGDAVGIVTARYLGAKHAAVPVSAYDAVDLALEGQVQIERTRIGSPWVIDAMNAKVAAGLERVVGWEANGGFLTATSLPFGVASLPALPTRDATLPIVSVLLAATESEQTLSALFGALPARATRAGLLDEFAPDKSRALLAHVRPTDDTVQEVLLGEQVEEVRAEGRAPAADAAAYRRIAGVFETYFPAAEGFGEVVRINFIDGVRAWFDSDEIVHLRPSGNAPQFRIYTVAGTQARADEIVDRAIAEPEGTLRRMERDLVG